VQPKRVAVALLGIGEDAELARGIREQKRAAQLLLEDVRSLERPARRFEVVQEESGEPRSIRAPLSISSSPIALAISAASSRNATASG